VALTAASSAFDASTADMSASGDCAIAAASVWITGAAATGADAAGLRPDGGVEADPAEATPPLWTAEEAPEEEMLEAVDSGVVAAVGDAAAATLVGVGATLIAPETAARPD